MQASLVRFLNKHNLSRNPIATQPTKHIQTLYLEHFVILSKSLYSPEIYVETVQTLMPFHQRLRARLSCSLQLAVELKRLGWGTQEKLKVSSNITKVEIIQVRSGYIITISNHLI